MLQRYQELSLQGAESFDPAPLITYLHASSALLDWGQGSVCVRMELSLIQDHSAPLRGVLLLELLEMWKSWSVRNSVIGKFLVKGI